MKIIGKVIQSKGKGRSLGYPTANIRLGKPIASGVYRGAVAVKDKTYRAGIFVGSNQKILEAYLLDFKGDLYGQEITVEIGEKIREVMRFKDDEKAKKRIGEDIELISSKQNLSNL